MKGKIILQCLFLILAVGFASAATYHGEFGVNVGSGSIVFNPGQCQEDWSGSDWGSCNNGQQTFICFDKNSCGTENVKPASCGQIRACEITPPSSSSSSGGGSGGGSSSSSSGGSSSSSSGSGIASLSITSGDDECVESWGCGSWSNLEEQCGTRSCTDDNTCGTTELKPLTFKSCSSSSSSEFGSGITSFFSAVGSTLKSGTGLGVILALIIVVLLILMNVASKRRAPSQEKITEVLESSGSENVKGKKK